MAWKEASDASGLPKLDLGHPRVKAAMKVTGILESDLKAKPPALKGPSPASPYSARATLAITDKAPELDKTGASTARSETLARSRDLWERKQRQMLRELEATADALDDADVEAILAPVGLSPEEAAAEYAKRKQQVERMRERIRAQLRKEAEREISKSSVQDAAAKEREALAKRIEEQAKLQKEAQKLQAEKRAAQHQKVQARVKEGFKTQRQRRDEITSKLGSANERVEKMLEERLGGASGKREEVRSRLARIAEQKMAHEEAELERKVRRYEDALRHDEMVEDRLVQAREEEMQRLEERRLKFSGKLDEVTEKQALQEREREKKFLDNAKKLGDARQLAAAKTKEALELAQAARDKHLNKWTTNRQSLVKTKREYVKELKTKLSECHAKADEGRDKYYEEQVLTRSANRGMLRDVVEANRRRLERGDDTARRQTLAKIEREMARTEAAAAQKKQIQAYRTQVIKESMDSKVKVEELRSLDPSAGDMSTRRINDILQHLDMPALPSSAVKEGEEGQQQ